MLLGSGLIVISIFIASSRSSSVLEYSASDVLLLESDLKTPEACNSVKWASRRAQWTLASYEHEGFWFCLDSIIGRLVDSEFIKFAKKAKLVHYILKPQNNCSNKSAAIRKDVYIYWSELKEDRLEIIEEASDDSTLTDGFIQKAITLVETEADEICDRMENSSALKSSFVTLRGVDA